MPGILLQYTTLANNSSSILQHKQLIAHTAVIDILIILQYLISLFSDCCSIFSIFVLNTPTDRQTDRQTDNIIPLCEHTHTHHTLPFNATPFLLTEVMASDMEYLSCDISPLYNREEAREGGSKEGSQREGGSKEGSQREGGGRKPEGRVPD